MTWQFYPKWHWLPWVDRQPDGDLFCVFAGWGFWQFHWYEGYRD